MDDNMIEEAPAQRGGTPSSRQVNWHETYAFTERFAASQGVALDHGLIAGTPQWCGMADDDARKLLALVLGGVREALTHDTRQAALADASREISSAATWSRIGRARGASYIARKGSA